MGRSSRRRPGRQVQGLSSMPDSKLLDPEESRIPTHLTIVQGVINRMADNSRWCKVWCVTLVSAALVLAARTDNPHHPLVALAPVVLFLILDAYYLGLERSYRWSYNGFVKHLHQGKLQAEQLYRVTKCGSDACYFLSVSDRPQSGFSMFPLLPQRLPPGCRCG